MQPFRSLWRIARKAAAIGDVGRISALIAVMLSVFGVLILGTIAYAGWSANESATQRERTLVENALNRAISRTLDEQKSVAWWDDSITNIREGAIDYDFVDANFGYFLTETYGHDEVFILNPAEQPIYGFRDGERLDAEAFEARRAAMAPAIAEARGHTANALRPRPDLFREAQTNYRVLSGAVDAAGWSGRLLTIEGRPAVVAALTIVPNVDMSLTPETPNLLVSVRFIDEEFISEIGRSLLLPDLMIQADAAHPKGQVAEPFVTDDGVYAGSLVWTTRQPGKALLTRILPMAVVGLLAAAILFYSMFRNLKRASGELATREALARHDAKHDSLSGLPNRAHFVEQLGAFLDAAELDARRKALVVYLDVDRFKDINDTLGHAAGDLLIKGVSARLRAMLAEQDFLARFGGDEFAILREISQADDAHQLCERIKSAFAAPFTLAGQNICVTSSIGLAVAPEDGRDADQIMRHADIALYRAKANGRDQAVQFTGEMAREVEERRSTELDLRIALQSDQLMLHYQPLISCRTQRVVAVEALLRWNHPTRGAISPATFIPIAEETGLMPELGEWILRRAMRDANRWPELEIAVNLSPVQIRHLDLVTALTRLARRYGVNPSRLVLEMTEGVLLDPAEISRETLAKIRALGFKTSLDDFGTGYSSLSYLSNFTFDKIKIDRAFVTGKADSHRTRTIVQAVTAMGRGLGMSVVAEGVETEVDALLMRQLGCTELQGYYFSRAVPADEVQGLIDKYDALAAAAPAEPAAPTLAAKA